MAGITIPKERWHELTHQAAALSMIKDAVENNKHADGTVKTYQEVVEEVKFLVGLAYGED